MKRSILLSLCATPLLSCTAEQQAPKQPNIIFILADDLGIGDLSCYGQERFATPNIDRLANEGMQFTQHYSGNTVSAPSRCVLMTGLHTGHSYIRDNRNGDGEEGQYPLSDESYTMAEMFKEAGYATGAFGKWGLGMPSDEGGALNQGFDTFCGYYCQSYAHRYYPEYIWLDNDKLFLEGNDTKNKVVYAPDVVHNKALDFIRKNAESDKPFFAYVPVIQPHAELIAPEDEILASLEGKYPEDKPWDSGKAGFDYGDPDFVYHGYASQKKPRTNFAAMVLRVDKYVGEILALVEELGIDENTLIVFSSDNGAHIEGGADIEFFNSNGPYQGHKRDMYDGGIHVPMLARWSGVIEAGVQNPHISAFWDFLPTFSDLAGVDTPAGIDGISMVPTLVGENDKQEEHEYLYWEFEAKWMNGRRAVRMGNWKGVQNNVFNTPADPIEIYDVTVDAAEENNLAEQHPEIVERIAEIFKEARTESELFKFDGTSK